MIIPVHIATSGNSSILGFLLRSVAFGSASCEGVLFPVPR